MNTLIFNTCAVIIFTSAMFMNNVSAVEADGGSAVDKTNMQQQDRKSMRKNRMMKHSDREMKMMDSDKNGVVTKVEFMVFHEKKYDKMKQENGGVSYKNSMNNKPMGTASDTSKNGSVDITNNGPVNGTTTGTNNQ